MGGESFPETLLKIEEDLGIGGKDPDIPPREIKGRMALYTEVESPSPSGISKNKAGASLASPVSIHGFLRGNGIGLGKAIRLKIKKPRERPDVMSSPPRLHT
jgi:hypothetical protein